MNGAETGREGRLRSTTPFSVPATRAVAAEEVIHRLLGRQPADRRQHAEGVGGICDDVLGRAGDALWLALNEVQRIAGARVLGVPRCRGRAGRSADDDHVLQHRAEALGGGVDSGSASRLSLMTRQQPPSKLKTVFSPQPCSSSPIRVRGRRRERGLARPDRPKRSRRRLSDRYWPSSASAGRSSRAAGSSGW